MAWHIAFIISGESFEPDKIDFEFSRSHRASDIATLGKNKGKPYGYGSASYVVSCQYSRQTAFHELAELFEPKLKELELAGADCWRIEIGRLYNNQCNEELSSEEIKQIARLECPLHYSAYAVNEKEVEQGWSED